MLCPHKAGILGNGSLRLETVDVADLGDDPGGVDFANARNGGKRVGDDLKLLLNGFLQRLDLLLHRAHGRNGNRHGLIDRVVDGFGKPVRASCSGLQSLRGILWISKAAPACRSHKCGQILQIGVGQIIYRFVFFHEGENSRAGVLDICTLSQARTLEE